MKNLVNFIGKWALVFGVLIALIFGLVVGEVTPAGAVILMVLGIIIGLLNVKDKQTSNFLFGGVAIIIAGSLGTGVFSQSNDVITRTLWSTFGAINLILVPAVIMVALRQVFAIAKVK